MLQQSACLKRIQREMRKKHFRSADENARNYDTGGEQESVEAREMEQIYDKFHASVYRMAFAYCKNRADAEDITSEVFLKRFGCSKTFESERHETAWMMRVTINQAKDLLRIFRRRNEVPLEEAALVFESPGRA